MPTEILSIVQQSLDFETRTNADWLDGWLIGGAPIAVDVVDLDNTGNGTIGDVDVEPLALADVFRVEISEIQGGATYFALRNLDGLVLKRGVVGAPFQAEGLTFTVSQGATPFAVDDGFTISVTNAPLDLTGISFRLTLRPNNGLVGRNRSDIALTATSDAEGPMGETLVSDGETGILSIVVPVARMKSIAPGLYDYDVIATADGYTAAVAVGTVEHLAGIS